MGPWVNMSGAKLDIQDPYGKKKWAPEMFGSLQNWVLYLDGTIIVPGKVSHANEYHL